MKINSGAHVFSPQAYQKVFSPSLSKSFLPKMERKLKGENETVLMDKNAHVQFIYLFFIFLCWARCLFSFLFLFFP